MYNIIPSLCIENTVAKKCNEELFSWKHMCHLILLSASNKIIQPIIHILDMYSKSRTNVRTFYLNYCNDSTLKMLYYAFINSILQNAIQSWVVAYIHYKEKLRTMQNHIL